METKEKRLCEYGAKCYRKNPKHFEEYSHPNKRDEIVPSTDANETSVRDDVNIKTRSSSNKKIKQTTLPFPKKCEYSCAPKIQTSERNKKKVVNMFAIDIDDVIVNEKESTLTLHKNLHSSSNLIYSGALKGKRKNSVPEKNKQKIRVQSNNAGATRFMNDSNEGEFIESTGGLSSDYGGVESPCAFVKNLSNEINCTSNVVEMKVRATEEIIKTLFLVDMPADFYSFYDFCKSINASYPFRALEISELRLTGPFDVLSGKMNYSVDRELCLCHWRFYYDPPEFQTVLVTESGFHIGYWRDEPNENPVFLASNNSDKDCIFKIEAENIFGTVFHYLNRFIKTCDPFKKMRITNLRKSLSDWAEKNKFSLEMKTRKMLERQKKVVSKTFHGAGIVVPVQPKSGVGYRPLNETDGNLKRICKLIMEASDEEEKESLWENLEPLITAANIANDECDFGNSLELGTDLFCMGSPIFHKTIEHLLSTAYLLLDRAEFEKIIKAHLKFRRKGSDLSMFGKV